MKKLKIVRRLNNKLYSWSAMGRSIVEYKIDEWVTAPEWLRDIGYHLLVFQKTSPSIARDWIHSVNSFIELWECDVKNKKPLAPILISYFLDRGEIKQVNEYCNIEYPLNTEMYEYVTLIKKIEWKE